MDGISSEARARIIAAADELWIKAGEGARFPTVDTVRRAARVSMNDASTVMREWRQLQTTQAATVAIDIPDRVHEAVGQAGSAIWKAAQDVASENLAAAQQMWDQERREAETMRKELADAYDAAEAEIEDLRVQIEQMKTVADQMTAKHVEEVHRLADVQNKTESRAERAEQDAQHQLAAAQQLAAEQKDLREKLSAALERGARAEQNGEDLRVQIEQMKTVADQMTAKHVEEVRLLEDVQHKAESRAERAEQDAQNQLAAVQQLAAEQKELREKLSAAAEKSARAEQRAEDLSVELVRERTRFDMLIQKLEGPRPSESSE